MQSPMIDALVDLALTSYLKRAQPSEYAKAAAHKGATLAAAKHHPDIADFAALTAAAAFYVEVTDAITFSARVTDAATRKLMSDSAYKAEWQQYSAAILPAQATQKRFFMSLAETPDKAIHDFSASVNPTFETIRVTDVAARNRAKRAAMHVYRDTYTIARCAYVRAMHQTSKIQNEHRRQAVFLKVMQKRLKQDLNYDVIHPHLMLTFISLTSVRILAALILLAAIGAILLGVFHVVPIPFIPLICAGSGAGFLTTSLLTGSFFARKSIKRIEEQNERREEICAYI